MVYFLPHRNYHIIFIVKVTNYLLLSKLVAKLRVVSELCNFIDHNRNFKNPRSRMRIEVSILLYMQILGRRYHAVKCTKVTATYKKTVQPGMIITILGWAKTLTSNYIFMHYNNMQTPSP